MIKLKDMLPPQDVLELLNAFNEKGASWKHLTKDQRDNIKKALGKMCASPKLPRCFYCEDGDASIIVFILNTYFHGITINWYALHVVAIKVINLQLLMIMRYYINSLKRQSNKSLVYSH